MSIPLRQLTDKLNNPFYPVTKERAVSDDNGVSLSTKLESFITKSVNDLVYYYTKSETYTKEEVATLIGAIQSFHYEIAASTSVVTSPANNVLYLIGPTGSGTDKYEEYVYDPTKASPWIKIGDTSIDLSNYVTIDALNTALANYTTTTDLTTLLSGKQNVISDLETIRSGAAAGATAYQKPSSGIPQSDLSSGIIEKLNKLEIFWAIYGTTTASEIQTAIDSGKLVLVKTDDSDNEVGMLSYYGSSSYFFIIPYYNGLVRYQLSNNVWSKAYVELQKTSDLVTSWNTTPSDLKYPSEKLVKDSLDKKYVKPTSGIPSSDLAPAVQTSLGKADTALQSFTETDPTVPSWAKAQNPPTEIFWAEWRVTTYAQIAAAYNAGKAVLCYFSGRLYTLGKFDESDARFYCTVDQYNYDLRVTNENVWNNGSYTALQRTSDKTDDIESNKTSTTKYPSTKGVADYIASKELSDLADVSDTAPTDGQALLWDGTNEEWKPGTVQSGSGSVTDVTVGGTSVVNQQGVAEVPEIPETVQAQEIEIDSTPTASSTNLVTSGGVRAYVDTQVGDIATLLAAI